MAKVYYSDPLFDELIARIPQDTMRHHNLLISTGCRIEEILKRKGWSQADLAKAMGKKESEISRWMGGGHNFTLETIAKIETVLGEEIISVKKYRKPVAGYSQMPEDKRKYLSDSQKRYGKKK